MLESTPYYIMKVWTCVWRCENVQMFPQLFASTVETGSSEDFIHRLFQRRFLSDHQYVCVCACAVLLDGLIYLFKIEQLVVRFLWSLMTSNEQNILTKPFLPLSVSPSVSCFSSPLIVSLYKSLAASLIIFSLLVSCPFTRGFLFLCPCCRPVLLKRKQLLEKQQLFLFCVNAEQILTSSVIFFSHPSLSMHTWGRVKVCYSA